jgi:nucleoside-diphosphate-sugar epimerase
MIIGNGLIAQSFKPFFDKYQDTAILFASGVSNSKLIHESEYGREKVMLEKALAQNKLVIYFSTCSIFDSTLQASRYINHKLEMESLIAKNDNYLIIRLPNVVGKTGNPNTMFNFFVNQIITGKKIEVMNKASRYIIDSVDVAYWTMELIEAGFKKNIVNLALPIKYKVVEIIEI